jgi:regulatory protein
MTGRRRRAGVPVDPAGPAGTPGRGVSRGGRGRAAEPEPDADPALRARDICLRLLAARPRTRAELVTALRRRGIPGDVVTEVLDRYDEVGIVDDRAFAQAWVTSRHHGRGLAGRTLAGELRRKGVDSATVDDAVGELDPATEEATARTLVSRRLRTESGTAPDALFRRLVGMLARKGYPAALAIRVVKEALAERAESAAFAEDIDPDALADAVDG